MRSMIVSMAFALAVPASFAASQGQCIKAGNRLPAADARACARQAGEWRRPPDPLEKKAASLPQASGRHMPVDPLESKAGAARSQQDAGSRQMPPDPLEGQR